MLPSTTVAVSRRTLHSKVSTQRACRERRRAVEVPPPSVSCPPHHPTPPHNMPASQPADSCTPVIYFSPPHLTERLLPITQGRGSVLTARHPARVLASRCDTLCCWTQPTGAPFPDRPGTSASTAGAQLGRVWVFNHQSSNHLLWSYLPQTFYIVFVNYPSPHNNILQFIHSFPSTKIP